MGIEHNGLGISVADYANTGIAVEIGQLAFEFSAEVSAFEIMDFTNETFFGAVGSHTGTSGA